MRGEGRLRGGGTGAKRRRFDEEAYSRLSDWTGACSVLARRCERARAALLSSEAGADIGSRTG